MGIKRDYLLTAINDTQATIRAIDVKVAALLAAVLIPISKLGSIIYHLKRFTELSPNWIFCIFTILFLIAWALTLIAFFRAIDGIDNPACHIVNANDRKGTFYGGGLYELGLWDVFFNRKEIKANKDPNTFSQSLPNNETEIENELAFEQMKLIYIREMKLNRLHWGYRFLLIWFILGIFIYFISNYFVSP